MANCHERLVGVESCLGADTEVVDACLDGGDGLARETLQLFGVLVEVLSPLCTSNAARLTRVGLADHGVVFCHREHLLFVAISRVGFMSGNELGANPYCLCSECKRCDESTTVIDATSCNNRNFSVDGINNLGNQCHCRDSASVSTCFSSLCNNKVATTCNCSNGVTDFSAHRTHKNVVLVELVDDLARNTEACHVDAGATFDDCFQVALNGIWRSCQKVNAEWLLCHLAHAGHLRNEKFCTHGCCAKGSDATCLRHCSNKVAVRDTAHAREHDGKFNIKHFGDACLHTSTVQLRLLPVSTWTLEELAVPPPRREYDRSGLIFEHPTSEIRACPVVGIDQSENSAGNHR